MRAATAVSIALTLVAAGRVPAGAQPDADACQAVGWRRIVGPTGPFSSLAASAALDRVYVGSRTLSTDPDQARATLYSGPLAALAWSAENLRDIRVSDVQVTPGRSTEVWVSTLGVDESFIGPVLGRAGGSAFAPMGQLRSQYMQLAATDSDVFAAVSKSGQQCVYRWDAQLAPTGDWTRVGADDIPTDYFRSFEAGANGRLWLGTDRQGLWASSDGGATWARVRGADTETVRALAIDPGNPGHVLAGLGYPANGASQFAKGIRYTDDGGQNWHEAGPAGIATANLIGALAISPLTGAEAYAAAWQSGLWHTSDGGKNWHPFPTPAGQAGYIDALLLVTPSDRAGCQLLFAGGADGVWVRNLVPPPVSIYVPSLNKKLPLR